MSGVFCSLLIPRSAIALFRRYTAFGKAQVEAFARGAVPVLWYLEIPYVKLCLNYAFVRPSSLLIFMCHSGRESMNNTLISP